MPRYVAFLRGVSPLNARMPDLRRAVEAAGFTAVRTVLASGNVVFDARSAAVPVLERKVEAAMAATPGPAFAAVVRSVAYLDRLLADDPYAGFELPPGAKRVVSFLKHPPATPPALPFGRDGALILAAREGEVFSAYVAGPKGPVFMALIERSFGTRLTTRSWETVRKCAGA